MEIVELTLDVRLQQYIRIPNVGGGREALKLKKKKNRKNLCVTKSKILSKHLFFFKLILCQKIIYQKTSKKIKRILTKSITTKQTNKQVKEKKQ